jgi:3-hydroxyacyl-[acyl-carrier-protein] dehydratase
MEIQDISPWIRRLRRSPLMTPGSGINVQLDRYHIERLIPHRSPFLLLDSINRVDLEEITICGQRFIDLSEPLFEGHFPSDPVYPGVLQIEMVGQLALCLASLLENKTTDPNQVTAPARIRASRIHQTVFYAGVVPNNTVTIYASLVEQDELAATAAGQIYCGGNLCSVCLLEVCFVD